MKKFSFSKIYIFKEKFSNFIWENPWWRWLKVFLRHKVYPVLSKIIITLFLIILAILILLKIFKPTYLEKIYQHSSFYFFHYLNLDNQNFSQPKITGNKRTSNEEITTIFNDVVKNFTKAELQKNDQQIYQPLIKKLITEIKKRSPWVNKITITRTMPDSINIAIIEYEPFAIWQNDGKKYITDKDGNTVLVDNIEQFKHLVILSGKGANNHAKSLFNIFAIDPNLSNRVYSATWLGGRRWDIRFDNALLIKLPEDNIAEAWHNLIKIYNLPGSIVGLKVIDLRVEGKIYLEYQDSIIKELKTL
ncbi:MAG: cell division protein FtsQ/DivIB [Rickettsiales bacterium]|nr:cell division protein FtsQ/DivIB [Rickettsiales bacterium]